MPLPTRRAVVAGAVGLLLVVVLPTGVGLPLWTALLVLAVVVDALAAPHPARVEVARQLPASVSLGSSAELVTTVRVPRRTHLVELAEAAVPSLGLRERRRSVRPAPGRPARVVTCCTPTRRGVLRSDGVTVRVHGPLGLGARQGHLEEPLTLEVHPAFRSRGAAELRVRRARLLEVGLRSTRGRGTGSEFDHLREYREGDEARRIDWGATARAGHPVVRTFRAERNQTVLLLVDTGRTMAGLVDGLPRLDHAMDAALALTTVATGVGDRVGMVAFADTVRARVGTGNRPEQVARVARGLFTLEPVLAESAYREAFAATLARQRRRSLLVLLTEVATEAVGETLLPALPILLARHEVVVAGVRDPAVDRWRHRAPADVDEAFLAASAARVGAERERTVALLRRAGARVVDAPPGELAGRLADAYLDLKASGAL
ncbi:MAG: DUF58 domain-containing protein [Actinomycetes bacterium]